MKSIYLLVCVSMLSVGCYEQMEGNWCHPLDSNPSPECYTIDSDGDGIMDAEDPCPWDKNLEHECGQGCSACGGATEYCVDWQCVDDCTGRECGQSPNEGFDCGSCSGATEYCVDGKCEELIWQDPPASNMMHWQQALDYCNNLTQNGHSDWRLPTISELRSLISGCKATETGGSCTITDTCLSDSSCRDDSCSGCADGGGAANGCYWPQGMQGTCSRYWSSSGCTDHISNAWHVNFNLGLVNSYSKDNQYYVRCVR